VPSYPCDWEHQGGSQTKNIFFSQLEFASSNIISKCN